MKAVNIPNSLTVGRIVLIPVFVIAVVYDRYRYALYLFVLAAITDLLDGLFARLADQKTALGTFLDPLADKLLLVTSFILFAYCGWIPKWLAIVVISRDLLIVMGWLLLYLATGHAKVEPVILGKTAIALQLVLLSWVLLVINVPSMASTPTWFFVIVAAMSALSGLQYIVKGLRQAHAF